MVGHQQQGRESPPLEEEESTPAGTWGLAGSNSGTLNFGTYPAYSHPAPHLAQSDYHAPPTQYPNTFQDHQAVYGNLQYFHNAVSFGYQQNAASFPAWQRQAVQIEPASPPAPPQFITSSLSQNVDPTFGNFAVAVEEFSAPVNSQGTAPYGYNHAHLPSPIQPSTDDATSYGLEVDFKNVSRLYTNEASGPPPPGTQGSQPAPEASSSTQFRCQVCQESFASQKNLQRHSTCNAHIRNERQSQNGTQRAHVPKYVCTCLYDQARKDNYIRHLNNCKREFEGTYYYQCSCGEESGDKGAHKNHVKYCGLKRPGPKTS
ncbi:hypothetical protein QBC46DRAFT_290738 [Diplogelasinospora grovesii]|uniref:C2H2-type domain-containing protein n=1 Tax=Diplogelasinospora grovesii TaxID=303347 RepID=A0AAN6N6J9_9PEZI|nr:hypothetical protein QBC46DRAFT_290738 [Diplogelasinospora grovesii]